MRVRHAVEFDLDMTDRPEYSPPSRHCDGYSGPKQTPTRNQIAEIFNSIGVVMKWMGWLILECRFW
jgi:hypothetical protein